MRDNWVEQKVWLSIKQRSMVSRPVKKKTHTHTQTDLPRTLSQWYSSALKKAKQRKHFKGLYSEILPKDKNKYNNYDYILPPSLHLIFLSFRKKDLILVSRFLKMTWLGNWSLSSMGWLTDCRSSLGVILGVIPGVISGVIPGLSLGLSQGLSLALIGIGVELVACNGGLCGGIS